MKHITTCVAAAALAAPACALYAQTAGTYPNHSVRVIVASSPGGGTDIQARLFTQVLSDSMKQQFVVDNRPGAGDTIGTGLTAKAPADGYTLLVVSPSFTMAPALYPKFPVDPTKDLAPISLVAASPLLLLVHPSLPVKSVKELVALAKAKPGTLDVGVGPNGTFTHLAAASFGTAAHIKINSIPYQNVGQRYSDVLAGHTHIIFMPGSAATGYIKSGRLRPLAVSGTRRSSAFPQLPTLIEAGVPGYDVTTWYGWVAPAGTPAAIISKLNAELIKALKTPEIARKLAEDGAEPVGSTPEQFAQIISSEVPRWRKATTDAGVRVD